ncbi:MULTISPECIES: diiron oxygenase [unclassified Pseudomonas]|uniref:diiron oxygenase n=1 Tax=unclassified Pseudomonas TaxID=196821 RepID=UPI00075BC6E5|nr:MULTISPECIES: diiron oxygenase [unclassified Pseudomonas]KVV01329.1 P-aminobenzoate N-oxygenase AurF [Pseudomonas sp. TAD18]KVV02687.1 P-aminobenzoate N-oxygenase AurF [Pseudomonas sp. TAA207]
MREHCPPEPFALYPPCTLPDWDTKASVRTNRSPYTLPADLEHQLGERHWFVPDFMPYLDHPDIVLAGPSVVRRLEANQLVYFLDYTTVLEHKLVNRAVETLIHDELGVPVPCAVKTAALQLYTDEGYHALFSNQIAEQVAELYGIDNRSRPASRIRRLLERIQACSPTDEAMVWFLIGFVSETIIAKELLSAVRLPLVSTVLHMFKSHLADEARHSRYFCDVFSHLWPLFDDCQRTLAATQLLAILEIFFESDTHWLKESLASVDLHPDTLEYITTRLQQPHAHQQRVRSGAKVTLQALFNAGFFNIAHNRHLFQNAGYIDA